LAIRLNNKQTTNKRVSSIPNAGMGLFVEGEIDEFKMLTIYSGVVYTPGDPLLLPSISNSYIIRRRLKTLNEGLYITHTTILSWSMQ